ncbi:MAG: hypothetical protein IJB00_03625 [Akkermansia sp.]|nr:hypothetical protein [Akkermansia sp.]
MIPNRRQLTRQEQEQREERRRLRELFHTPLGQQVLADLERRFEIHLPVFQGKPGSYDPLDAMRRDAHREVFLVIRHRLNLAESEANTTTIHTTEEDDEST